MVVDLGSYTSPQIKLIHEFDLAMHERNLDLLAKYLHKDFRHVTHPKSVGKPPIIKDEWLATMAEVFSTPIQYEKASYTGRHSIPTRLSLSFYRLPTIPSWTLRARLFFTFVP